jgi:hypothetical protein
MLAPHFNRQFNSSKRAGTATNCCPTVKDAAITAQKPTYNKVLRLS